MKNWFILSFCCLLFCSCEFQKESAELDLQILVGEWKLDMSPTEKTDSNFAMMRITQVKDNSFQGTFYREGVAIKHGQINTQLGDIRAALVSGDGTGQYNTSFYYEKGILYGITHAIDQNFLSVWTAKKSDPQYSK